MPLHAYNQVHHRTDEPWLIPLIAFMPTMTLRCCIALTVFSLIFCSSARGQQKAEGASIADVYTDKARYAPNESVAIFVQLKSAPSFAGKAALKLTFWHLGERVGEEIARTVDLPREDQSPISVDWTPPDVDYRGYLVGVRLVSSSGETLGTGYTAVDVSSQWNRFPRYGYLAHYSKAERDARRVDRRAEQISYQRARIL